MPLSRLLQSFLSQLVRPNVSRSSWPLIGLLCLAASIPVLMIVIMLDCDSIVKGTVLVIVLVIVRVLLLVIIVNVLSGGVAWVWTARQRSPAA